MLKYLLFLAAIPLAASLVYDPLIDSYSDLVKKVYKHYKENKLPEYDGYIFSSVGDSINEDLENIHAVITAHLSTPIKIKLEGISQELVEKALDFRKRDLEHFHKEFEAWQEYRRAYSVYGATGEGSYRRVSVPANDSKLTFEYCNQLRLRYQAVFNQAVQSRHICRKWQYGPYINFFKSDGTCNVWGLKKYSMDALGVIKLFNQDASLDGTYLAHITPKNTSISLELGDFPRTIPPKNDWPLGTDQDPWLWGIAQNALTKEVHRRIEGKKTWLTYDNQKRFISAEEEKALDDYFAAFQTYLKVAFDQREKMLPNGSITTYEKSGEKNMAIIEWIYSLDKGVPRPADFIEDELTSDILIGTYERPDKGELWHFKPGGNYEIYKADKLIEKGGYEFSHGSIDLFRDTHGPFKAKEGPMQLTEAEGKLWYLYLFGPLNKRYYLTMDQEMEL